MDQSPRLPPRRAGYKPRGGHHPSISAQIRSPNARQPQVSGQPSTRLREECLPPQTCGLRAGLGECRSRLRQSGASGRQRRRVPSDWRQCGQVRRRCCFYAGPVRRDLFRSDRLCQCLDLRSWVVFNTDRSRPPRLVTDRSTLAGRRGVEVVGGGRPGVTSVRSGSSRPTAVAATSGWAHRPGHCGRRRRHRSAHGRRGSRTWT